MFVCVFVFVCVGGGGGGAVHGHALYLHSIIILGKENEQRCMAGLLSLLDPKRYFMSTYYYPPYELECTSVRSRLFFLGGGVPPLQ